MQKPEGGCPLFFFDLLTINFSINFNIQNAMKKIAFFVTMFRCVESNSAASDKLFASVNTEAVKRGYLVVKEACSPEVLEWLMSQDLNPNSTFYKEWSDITSKNRLELAIDQIHHYLTTYGGLGDTPYVPNDEPLVLPWENYTVISAVSREEMVEKCLNLLKAGIALKEDNVRIIADYLIANKELLTEDSLEGIKNRDIKVILWDKLGLYPSKNPDELLRYIIYKVTGIVTFVKNYEFITAIKNGKDFDLSNLSFEARTSLSRIFLRNKDVFLALKKKGPYNASIVNRLRKDSVRNHVPQKKSLIETLLSKEHGPSEIIKVIKKIPSFKLVSLMTEMKLRQDHPDLRDKIFVVRNGRIFIRKDYAPKRMNAYYYGMVYQILEDTLIERISSKVSGLKIRLSDNISVPLPTSEKNFIGGYPFGTTIDLSENTFIGCYWMGMWNTSDYDLHYDDIHGHSVGWDSRYYDSDHNIIYSGDMTVACPEACEVFYIKKTVEAGLVRVNRFSHRSGTKGHFRLFVANEKAESIRRNYMVKPESITFRTDVYHSSEKKEVAVGIVDSEKSKLLLMSFETSNSRVGGIKNVPLMVNYLTAKAYSMPNAVEMLTKAGAVISDDPEEEVDINFQDFCPEKIIEILG